MSDTEVYRFSPVDYSIQENQFLLENLGKAPIVAMRDCPVNPRAVRPILERVYALDQQEAHSGIKWVGVERLREKIRVYLQANAKGKADAARFRGPKREWVMRRYPTLFSFDSKGRGHRGGIGSDQGVVRTAFDAEGNRVPLEVELIEANADNWAPPGFTEKPTSKGLVVDDLNNRIECKICGHTESFKGASRASYNAARARMSKHLRRATEKVDEHREVHAEEFS